MINFTLTRRLFLVVLCLLTLVSPAVVKATSSTDTVIKMSTENFGNYFQSAGVGSNGIQVLGIPGTYYLSNGTTWQQGAGSFGGSASATAVGVSVNGSTIRYTLGNLTSSDLMNYTDYDSGNHSSRGTIDPYGPLILTAIQGATTATLNSTALITANPVSNYNDSRYNYYAAPVGSVVPFTVTYELSGSTWQPNTFSTSFSARPEGLITFTPVAVPEPSLLALGTIALVILPRRRRRNIANRQD